MNFDKALTKVFGSSNERFLKSIRPTIALVNDFEPQVQKLTDEQMRERTAFFKAQIADAVKDARDKDDRKYREQQALNAILAEAFALVREASVRTTGMRHFDVQMIGGLVLHKGKIAEMRTGEGKTLVATLPAYLNALTGRGVNVITVNDYLAARDAVAVFAGLVAQRLVRQRLVIHFERVDARDGALQSIDLAVVHGTKELPGDVQHDVGVTCCAYRACAFREGSESVCAPRQARVRKGSRLALRRDLRTRLRGVNATAGARVHSAQPPPPPCPASCVYIVANGQP